MFSLEGKVTVVTGGASGIGRATVERFAAAGAKVVLADIQDGSSVAESTGATYVRTDVSDEPQVKRLMDTAAELRGHIDVCINNAGIVRAASIVDTSAEMFESDFRVNAMGVFFGMKHAVAHMGSGGSMINTASMASLIGAPGVIAYTAAKTAVVGLTRVAAIEFGSLGIRVNCICPGSINTPMRAAQENATEEIAVSTLMSPLGRTIEPEEVAALMHFLAAGDCPAITGQAIVIDAGMQAGLAEGILDAAVRAWSSDHAVDPSAA